MSTALTIGQLSRLSGTHVETIRYYERINLLPKPDRTAAGYRHYTHSAATRLRFIRRGRELGFSIEEIRTLLQLADDPEHSCAEADAMARKHLREIEDKIRDLQQMHDELQQLVGCESSSARHCRLLEALELREAQIEDPDVRHSNGC